MLKENQGSRLILRLSCRQRTSAVDSSILLSNKSLRQEFLESGATIQLSIGLLRDRISDFVQNSILGSNLNSDWTSLSLF